MYTLLITREEFKSRMAILLAGRASEELTIGQTSTGATDNLVKVTDIARQIVTRFGMSEQLGQVVLEGQRSSYLGESVLSMTQRGYGEATACEVDLAMRALVEEAYGEAMRILQERKQDLDRGAALLLEKETLTSAEIPAMKPSGSRPQSRSTVSVVAEDIH